MLFREVIPVPAKIYLDMGKELRHKFLREEIASV